MADELSEQPAPSDSKCPSCGAEPTDASQVEHRLSNIGYMHDDVVFECSNDDCQEEWTCGVPIGEYEGELAERLLCDSCEKRYMLVHRIQPMDGGGVELNLKCPNPNCHYFKREERHNDDGSPSGGIVMMGYPQITGDIEDAEPYGY